LRGIAAFHAKPVGFWRASGQAVPSTILIRLRFCRQILLIVLLITDLRLSIWGAKLLLFSVKDKKKVIFIVRDSSFCSIFAAECAKQRTRETQRSRFLRLTQQMTSAGTNGFAPKHKQANKQIITCKTDNHHGTEPE